MIRGRNQKAILQHIIKEMQKQKIDALILTSPHDVFYSTGYCSRSLYRCGKTGATISVVTIDGDVSLFCSEFERKVAESTCDSSIKIESYPVWIYIEDYASDNMVKEAHPDINKVYRKAVELIRSKNQCLRVGVNSKWITYDAGTIIREAFGMNNVLDCSKVLSEARLIKTPWEIEVLRYNARLAERAMNLTIKEIVPGMTIQDVHYFFHKICLEIAPELTYVSNSHTIGPNFCPAWIPTDYRIEYGDLIRFDGGPYTNGYKSDLARTYAVGQASKEKEALYAALYKGYKFGIENIRPGIKMSDIFKGIEHAIGMPKYIRGHFGHSISCDVSGEEYPFIGPNEDRTFEPGMVMCIETPFYSSIRQTYNIEDTFVVTENGIELFTKAAPSMYL